MRDRDEKEEDHDMKISLLSKFRLHALGENASARDRWKILVYGVQDASLSKQDCERSRCPDWLMS